jgi:hypothetical protein
MATKTKRGHASRRNGRAGGDTAPRDGAETRVQAAPLDMLLSEAAI